MCFWRVGLAAADETARGSTALLQYCHWCGDALLPPACWFLGRSMGVPGHAGLFEQLQ